MKLTVNGIEHHVQLGGPETAPVVMLSHSLASSMVMWNPQLAVLEQHFRVLRYDVRGHGGSATSPVSYSLDDLAADVVGLLDSLDIQQVHFVGLSMGGMIGQGLGIHHPGRLLSLCLCDTMAQVPAEAQSTWQERIDKAREGGMAALAEATLERWFTAPFRNGQPDQLAPIRQSILETPVEGFVGAAEAIRKLDYLAQLSGIRLPTLVMVGADDTGTPVSAAEAIQQRIPGAQLRVLPNAAHLANIEQSHAFNETLLGFLQGLD